MPLRPHYDLIARLFSYSPREGRKPLEDYCTEAFAWCLTHSHELRERFFSLLGHPGINCQSVPLLIETQYSFRSSQLTNSTVAVPEVLRGRIDLLICPEESKAFLIIIESKFRAGFGESQLDNYRNWLAMKRTEGYETCLLVTLTEAQLSPDEKPDAKLLWSDVQQMLETCPISDPVAEMVSRSFASFLKEQGISFMKINECTPTELNTVRSYLELVNQMDDILNHFRNQDSPGFPLPKLSKVRTNEDTAAWRGVYSDSKTYYVGFGISLIGEPMMFLWVEFTVEGNREHLVEQFSEELKGYHSQGREWMRKIEQFNGNPSEPPLFDGSDTFFAFVANTSGKLNGNARLMLEWFNSVSQQMIHLLGADFKP